MTTTPFAQSSHRTVLVLGDVRTEWLVVKRIGPKKQTLSLASQHGGAWLLADLYRQMAGANTGIVTYERAGSETDAREPAPSDFDALRASRVASVVLELKRYPRRIGRCMDKAPEVLRVEQQFDVKGSGQVGVSGQPPLDDSSNTDSGLALIDDMNMGFREQQTPASLANCPHVVLTTRWPLGSELWKRLTRNTGNSARLVVVLNASYLRGSGVQISRGLSWQRSVREVIDNFPITELEGATDVILRLGHEAALHWRSRDRRWDVYYYADRAEDHCKDTHPGDMMGSHALFTAGIGQAIAEGADLAQRIKWCLTYACAWHAEGFGEHEPAAYPLTKVAQWIKEGPDKNIQQATIEESKRSSSLFLLDGLADRATRFDVAADIVRSGLDGISTFPRAVFGDVVWLDPREVEAYRHVASLIGEYLRRSDPKRPRPLSIAVFGHPGAGKSFGVRTVAETLGALPELEFNLSQWDSPTRLVTAFHKVREAGITGQVPLVFFDEFDAHLGQELGWLKYFLAPMQSGKFRDGESEYSLGNAVMVFAGSTSYTFEEFQEKCLTKDAAVKAAKARDFLSRLRGHINVLGPTDAGESDMLALIRRALILRDNIQKKARNLLVDNRANIDDRVLQFLLDANYRHGARSMEAVLEMSRLAGKAAFGLADLPPRDQLNLHVAP